MLAVIEADEAILGRYKPHLSRDVIVMFKVTVSQKTSEISQL